MRLHLEHIEPPEPEKRYQPEWIQVEGKTFEGVRIPVDNHQYGKCRFVGCTFLYSGGPFGFYECEVDGNCYIALASAARRTLDFWPAFQEHLLKMSPLC